MFRSRRVKVASVAAGLCSILALVGCGGLGIAQGDWERRVSDAPGVVSAESVKRTVSITTFFEGEIVVSPGLTDDQAREIARLSCEDQPELSQITVTASAPQDAWEARQRDLKPSCFNPELLVGFARVLGALQAVHGFEGEALVAGEPDPESEDALQLRVLAEEETTLIDLLSETHDRSADRPLRYVAEQGLEWKGSSYSFSVNIPAGYNLDTVLPLLTRVVLDDELPRSGVSLEGDVLVINVPAVVFVTDPQYDPLRADAEAIGLTLELRPPSNYSTDVDEQAAHEEAIGQIRYLPGVTSVTYPSGSEQAVVIEVTRADRIPGVLEYLGASPVQRAAFSIEAPEPDVVFVRVEPGGSYPRASAALEAMTLTRVAVPEARVTAVNVSTDGVWMRLDLDADASDSDRAAARKVVNDLIDSGMVDEATLSGLDSGPEELP